jgi:peptidylprolyl isomerase domain and WD repeat-containing protein 1
VVSVDAAGLIEYWDASLGEGHHFPEAQTKFTFKTQTDLYDLAKTSTTAMSLTLSKTGKLFAIMGEDRLIRIFNFASGKILRRYDDSLAAIHSQQKEPQYALDAIDFGRRVAVESTLEKHYSQNRVTKACNTVNVIFDESENYVMYSTLLGIKLVDLVSNNLVTIIGKVENTERFLFISLYQGKTEGSVATGTHSANSKEDPTIFATAFNKARFYLFTRREPEDADGSAHSGRDVFNERPELEGSKQAPMKIQEQRIAKSAIVHTTMGDIHLQLHADKCPKTVENFTMHCKNGYYNGVIFHRVVKSFMIQTGDPLGDGTGGTSIWGKEFEDEFHQSLRHDAPFVLSMANRGPNTNGSQFFISVVPLPYLDFKHTVFGKVTKGMDVVLSISTVPTDKTRDLNKPFTDIKIINIEVNF